MIGRAALVTAVALAAAGCGKPLISLPAGPGAPAPDAAGIVDQATMACRRISTITAEIGVSGSVNGHRLRGRLSAGFAVPASARLEAVSPFGQPLFIYVANGDDATLLLPRDERVLEHGRPAEVLEAVAGVPLDSSDLRKVITGCVDTPDVGRARQPGDAWRVVPDGANEVYFRRDKASAPWQLVATVHGASGAGTGWRAEYRDFDNGVPRTIRISSTDRDQFDLGLSLSQIETNVSLGAEAFRVQIPRSAAPITLSELRDSGPLRTNDR